jgi:hypothetical protein
MNHYRVTLAYNVEGTGSTMTIPLYAYSEVHACQLAQSQNPGMFALSAVLG